MTAYHTVAFRRNVARAGKMCQIFAPEMSEANDLDIAEAASAPGTHTGLLYDMGAKIDWKIYEIYKEFIKNLLDKMFFRR
jgi:hypothetical protein